MPVYEYLCDKCGKTTEALRRMDQADEPLACEYCGACKTQRVQSVFAAAAGSPSSGAAMPGACGAGGCCCCGGGTCGRH